MKDEQTLRYERKIREGEERLRKYEAEMKALARQNSTLKRNARTHRLCTIGGMVEKHLIEPDLLDEGDVEKLLNDTLGVESVQKQITSLVAAKKAEAQKSPTENPPTEKQPRKKPTKKEETAQAPTEENGGKNTGSPHGVRN